MSTTTTATYYTTLGSVRGCCGHRHSSIRTAAKCLAKDRRAVQSRYPSRFPTRAYSDRRVVRVPDGTTPGDLRESRIARTASDITMGEYVDDRPQWVDEYDLPESVR